LDGDYKSLSVNPNTNKIYVANYGAKTIDVIDGKSGNITEIPVHEKPFFITVNPNTNKIYTANPIEKKVIILNGTDNAIMAGLLVKDNPVSFTVNTNPNTNIIYAIDGQSNYVSVVDGNTNTKIGIIPVNKNPVSIVSNPDPAINNIYVANAGSNTVTIYENNKTYDVPVGKNPSSIAVNPVTDKIYVANKGDNTVSVIDGSSKSKIIQNIPVGKNPSSIAVNPDTNIIYVANEGSDTVTTIDGATNKVVVGVIMNVNPPASGHIRCNDQEQQFPLNLYLFTSIDTKCIAEPNDQFFFSSWVENFGHDSIMTLSEASSTFYSSFIPSSFINSFSKLFGSQSKDDPSIILLNQHGKCTANFRGGAPLIPPSAWIPLYGVIFSSIIGFSIPTMSGWIKSANQRKKLMHIKKEI